MGPRSGTPTPAGSGRGSRERPACSTVWPSFPMAVPWFWPERMAVPVNGTWKGVPRLTDSRDTRPRSGRSRSPRKATA